MFRGTRNGKFKPNEFLTPIDICSTIPKDDLERIFYETRKLAYKKRMKIKLSQLVKMGLKHPKQTLKAIKKYHVFKLFKRVAGYERR